MFYNFSGVGWGGGGGGGGGGTAKRLPTACLCHFPRQSNLDLKCMVNLKLETG